MRTITMLSLVLFFVLSNIQPAIASSDPSCHGKFLNPITDINWEMIFPIRIVGIKISLGHGSTDSSSTVTSPICICPSHIIDIPVPGIMVTYHEPLYVEEIARAPGCLSSLGSLSILSGFSSEQTDLKEDENSASRWEVHWYEYPVFALLDAFTDLLCAKTSGFALAYLTEVDPTWQNDAWGVIYAPEAALFANTFAQVACATDAVAATASQPLDSMYWCAGSWGSVYPLTGNVNESVGRIQSANLAGAKLIARLSRVGMLWKTVGHGAICQSEIMPIWLKSEFSIDPVYPEAKKGNGMSIGANQAVWEYSPAQSYPSYENINQVIFQEQQCCIRP